MRDRVAHKRRFQPRPAIDEHQGDGAVRPGDVGVPVVTARQAPTLERLQVHHSRRLGPDHVVVVRGCKQERTVGSKSTLGADSGSCD